MFFSIIMPIYKVETYLMDSVNSVLTQSFMDYELILVDDGSPDGCPKICDDFAAIDKRIVVIHKKNGGLSDARNAGLAVAKGKYIVFLDSDDLMFEEALYHMYDQLSENEQIELLIGSLTYFINNKSAGEIHYPRSLLNYSTTDIYQTCTQFIKEIYRLPWAAYQCVYQRQYLVEYGYIYDKNIVGAEDCQFFMNIIKHVKNFKITDYSFVYYRKNRVDSIMGTQSVKTILGQLIVLANCYNDLKSIDSDTDVLRKYFANRYTNIIVLISRLKKKEDIQLCCNVINKNRNIIKQSKGKKYTFAKLFWFLFGFYKGSKILYFLKKINGGE